LTIAEIALARRQTFRLFAFAAGWAALAAGCALPGNSPWGPATTEISKNRSTEETSSPEITVRGQSPAYGQPQAAYPVDTMPGGYPRGPQPVSGGAVAAPSYSPGPYGVPAAVGQGPVASGQPVVAQPGAVAQPTYAYQPPVVSQPPLPPPPVGAQPAVPGSAMPFTPAYPGYQPPSNFPEAMATPTPLDVFVSETRTGQFMFGIAVNSDAGVTGQITINERNFDIANPPGSWDDVMNGTAWRGAGQGFRIEAQPGNRVQRYLISFSDPYFLDTNISFSASAFYFDRNYFDWTESRYGGRLAWGYRLTPDLSLSAALRAENVNLFDPRVLGVPELDESLGRNDLFSGRVTLTHDTRDAPFLPTEGHLVELSFEQAFGSFDYPRGEAEWAQYWMVRQRPDGSGRHTVAFSTKLGISGSDTPIFENYFAGGFSTMRGFAFRGASPIDSGIRVGGEFRWINSLEYFFPLTADDMIRGTVFCDFGTVERDVALRGDNFRVAPGVGLRINVPALGPAPLAFDFAFPVASADSDDEQTFSFFFGAMR
jgi:outer membrane protein insertion porin family